MSELVEQVARAIHDVLENDDDSKGGGYMRAARAALSVLEPRIKALEAENFKLAAGACNVEGGLIGDDHGHVYCSLKALIEALERELGWQPIETAPKDGTRILARIAWRWSDGKPSEQFDVIAWDERAGFWFFPTPPNYVQGLDSYSTLTHWRPLPPPPTGERG
jgi:hypothetical protein